MSDGAVVEKKEMLEKIDTHKHIYNIWRKNLSVKLLTKNTTPGTVMLKKKRHSV